MKTSTLYVATGNAGKLRDFSLAAAEAAESWTIAPLPGLSTIAAPAETGTTFAANARDKALYYAQFCPGEIVMTDDSGLAVDALDGEPGIYSARFAARSGFVAEAVTEPDARNNAALLAALRHSGGQFPFAARYLCVLAAVCDGAVLAIAEGSLEGEILGEPQGEGGFGYDPLFFLAEEQKTMAELPAQARLGLSHRGRALRRLLPQLRHSSS
jgi:XTP/dITP diphosphohydrolase